MDHTSGRVARCVHRETGHVTDFIVITILKQLVKLRTIPLELGAFVENLAKCFLNRLDMLPNSNFATKSFLNIWRT